MASSNPYLQNQPFKYGGTGDSPTNSFSQGMAVGISKKNSDSENALRQQQIDQNKVKMAEDASNKNALNVAAMTQDPAYKQPMQDSNNFNQLMQDQGVNPAQAQAIREQNVQARKDELAPYALVALTQDGKDFEAAKKTIADKLTDQEKQQYGDPTKWTKTSMASFLSSGQTDKILGTINNKEKADAATKNADAAQRRADAAVLNANTNKNKVENPKAGKTTSFDETVQAIMNTNPGMTKDEAVLIKNSGDVQRATDTWKESKQPAAPVQEKKSWWQGLMGGNKPATSTQTGQPNAQPQVMSEAAARQALATKGVTGPDADKWINVYRQAGKLQ